MGAADRAALGAANRQAVLDYLIREADLDGLATFKSGELARTVGISQGDVTHHLHRLIADGAITTRNGVHLGTSAYLPPDAPSGAYTEVQLAESVFA